MKTTLDLPDSLVKEIKHRAIHEGQKLKDAVADLLRKGLDAAAAGSPTVVKADKAMLDRRKILAGKFISGEWGVELAGHEPAKKADRRSTAKRAKAWRN